MVIRDFVEERERERKGEPRHILASISPVSISDIKTRSHTMRTRPNMKMLACLETLLRAAYEVAYKHGAAAFQLAREAQQAYSNRPAAGSETVPRGNNAARKEGRRKKRAMKHVRLLHVFSPSCLFLTPSPPLPFGEACHIHDGRKQLF